MFVFGLFVDKIESFYLCICWLSMGRQVQTSQDSALQTELHKTFQWLRAELLIMLIIEKNMLQMSSITIIPHILNVHVKIRIHERGERERDTKR